MSSHSAVQSTQQESISPAVSFSGVKAQYDKYRAHAINLHMLADQCPETVEQQENFDRQQLDGVKGQLTVLNKLSGHTPKSEQEAQLMMSVWREEILQGSSEDALSETDQIALRIFDFFESQIVAG